MFSIGRTLFVLLEISSLNSESFSSFRLYSKSACFRWSEGGGCCSSSGRAWGKIVDLSSGEEEWGLSRDYLTGIFYTLTEWCNLKTQKDPQDWNQFDTSLKLHSVIKTKQPTRGLSRFTALPWIPVCCHGDVTTGNYSLTARWKVWSSKNILLITSERERETVQRVCRAEPHLLRCILHI